MSYKHMINADFEDSFDDFEQQEVGGVSKSMLKKSRLNFDKIEKCK